MFRHHPKISKCKNASKQSIFMQCLQKFNQNKKCIPVGCIPPACSPYLPVCTAQGGSSLPGGLPCQRGSALPRGGVLPCRGGGLPCHGGSVLPGGVSLPGGLPCQGVCLVRGGLPCRGGGSAFPWWVSGADPGGGPGGLGPPLTLCFEAPKLSIFGPYLIFL